ncbi:MAG: hypothetical protein ACK4LQ_04790 [Pararhodobacter sp.]
MQRRFVLPASRVAPSLMALALLMLPACQMSADPISPSRDPIMPVTRPDPRPVQTTTIGRTEFDRSMMLVECPGDPALEQADHALLCRMLAQSLADRAPDHLVRLLAPGEAVPATGGVNDRVVALRLTRVSAQGLSGRLDEQTRSGQWRSGPVVGFDRMDAAGLSPDAIVEFARHLASTLGER